MRRIESRFKVFIISKLLRGHTVGWTNTRLEMVGGDLRVGVDMNRFRPNRSMNRTFGTVYRVGIHLVTTIHCHHQLLSFTFFPKFLHMFYIYISYCIL